MKCKLKVQLDQVAKNYGQFTALHPTELDVRDGEFLTLLGPSGSGKTTILNLISGMTQVSSGRVLIDGQDVTHVPSNKRGLGMVFQHYALMPHMTVAENIAYPLKVRKRPRAEITERVKEALETVRLPDAGNRKPSELSGGQQQRIAIARCLVYKPSIILMDEPLGALDKKLREEMQLELKRLHAELKITALYVTHDQEEALTMSDRIVLMNKGRIEQMGMPDEMYFKPNSVFSATFLGDSNLVYGRVSRLHCGGSELSGALGTCRSVTERPDIPEGSDAVMMVRPESLRINATDPTGNVLVGTIIDSISYGGMIKHYLRMADGTTMITQELVSSARPQPEPGSSVTVSWRPEDSHLLPPGETQAAVA